jgi:hypothetical protein
MRKTWGDIGWFVELKPYEPVPEDGMTYSVTVLAWRISYAHADEVCLDEHEPGDEPDKEKAWIHGFIKWDGCSNLDISEKDCMLHFCKREQLVNLGVVLGRLFDEAMVMMPYTALEKGQSWPETQSP